MRNRFRWARAAGALLLTAELNTVAAQVEAAIPMASDSFMALVPPREIADIERELAGAEHDLAAASKAQQRAVALRTGAEARLEANKRQISAVEGRKKVAKQEKHEAEIAALEAEKRGLERQKNLLERRKSLREAEIDLAKRRSEVAVLRRQALDLERQLILKRTEQAGVSGTGPEASRGNQVVLDLEEATLEAQRKLAERQGDVVNRDKRVVEHRLKILKAQRSVMGGR